MISLNKFKSNLDNFSHRSKRNGKKWNYDRNHSMNADKFELDNIDIDESGSGKWSVLKKAIKSSKFRTLKQSASSISLIDITDGKYNQEDLNRVSTTFSKVRRIFMLLIL